MLYSRPVLTALFGGLLVLVPLLALANILATSVTDSLDRAGLNTNSALVQTEEVNLGHRIAELTVSLGFVVAQLYAIQLLPRLVVDFIVR